ncbi:DNA primase family protein [Thauera sp. SDU_THAU2]|uniref:DNA primase family protein n=1 Tax=Thauera sp. SDU_THAU2 TaxID=3136633 RepID=UPI00311FB516
MSNDFNMNEFLRYVEKFENHVCIDEIFYEWTGNNWQVLKDKYGEAFAFAWMKSKALDSISKNLARTAWTTLKLDLLSQKKKIKPQGIVIPCDGTYVIVSDAGEISAVEPAKEYYCTYSLACPYVPDAPTPLFNAFLEQVLPDEQLRQRVQEFVGYTLLPDHRFQRAAMWLGAGANGKGVLSNIVQALHSDVAAIQLDNKSRFGLSGLYNASLIVADELPPGKLDEGRLKSITAGEPVFIDIKGQEPITTRVRGKLLVLGNNFPSVDDASDGFWRRWEVIPFKTTIPLEQRDPKLAEKIIEQELAGVLNWALAGLQRLLKRNGFDPARPAAMEEVLKSAKLVADDVTGWLSDRVQTVTGPLATKKADIYSDYHRWCTDNDFVPRPTQGFWLKLKRCRTDMTAKKVRIPGGYTQNACTIVLKPLPEIEFAANCDQFSVAA